MEMTRGDTARYKFRRLDDEGNPITEVPDNVYFTVKEDYFNLDPVLQKTINDMSFDENYYFHFTINPEDTENLMTRNYVYDIQVNQGNYKQTIAKGVFKLTKEVTYVSNEV